MKPLYTTLLVLLLTVCGTAANAQTVDSLRRLSPEQLTAYRQRFCDYLPLRVSFTTDFDSLFTSSQLYTLDSTIRRFQLRKDVQICIVTLDTLCVAAGRVDDMALHIANAWGVGEKGKNNGVTICICAGHRRMKICNGRGIVKVLSDAETKAIIDRYFIPRMKEKEYYLGTLEGLNAIIALLNNRL